MSFKYILFDLDGTLTDPKEGITKSVQYALKSFGIDEPDLDKLIPFIGPPLVESFHDFYSFTPEMQVRGVEKYREYFRNGGIFQNQVLPGVPEMLAQLKHAGKIISLATSKPEPFARQILEHFSLTSYFDEIVGCGMDESRGTKREVIEEVFLRLHMGEEEKAEAVMVGDRKHDVLAAKACGIATVGLTFGYAAEGELEAAGADVIISSFNELTQYLL